MTNEILIRLIRHAAELAESIEDFDIYARAYWEDPATQDDATNVEEDYNNISKRFGMLTTEYGKLTSQIGQRAQETARIMKHCEQINAKHNREHTA